MTQLETPARGAVLDVCVLTRALSRDRGKGTLATKQLEILRSNDARKQSILPTHMDIKKLLVPLTFSLSLEHQRSFHKLSRCTETRNSFEGAAHG